MPDRTIVGWDVGGAHLKACLMQRGQVVDVAQWACPLWQGMAHLEHALEAAGQRWPALDEARHAVTMTGEMVDLFADREDGVQRIARQMSQSLRPSDATALQFFAGDSGWLGLHDVARHWERIASANWLATARHAALSFGHGVLVDIGSTTTDLVVFKGGRVASSSRTDADRLATGELVYHGVVRTPLCAIAHRIDWRGTPHNVMNEFFATTADVYRLTGDLDPAHDLYPSADGAPKDPLSTRRRLARMIGLDERDGAPEDWLAFARAWRTCQVAELGSQLRRVMASHPLPRDAIVVRAGCGGFLVEEVIAHAGAHPTMPVRSYGADVARAVADWAKVCAASVAVAALLDRESR
ncbi:MAG: H4MPT-linked C1 transfer pathway protein [Vitreoscilla sp.]|nr:H4MPT-linked C1 transfer pathway protein [Vitreoscilla sp.]